MLQRRAFRYRVHPTPEQERRLIEWQSALRWLWNLANEQRLMGLARSNKRYPTAFDQINELTALRVEAPWIANVPRNVCAQLLVELDKAWLARAQRRVSRRQKGSKNREKAKRRVMRLHRKVRRQREHVLHVESARLAKSHGVVVIEKLNVAGMVRGRLSRSIADEGWSRFANMLRYKLAWSGGKLVEVPAAYSSQTCGRCSHVDAASRHGELFRCTSCGHADHADLNAAKVLKTRANRSGLPAEGLAPEAAQRSRKVRLRVPRRSSQSPAL